MRWLNVYSMLLKQTCGLFEVVYLPLIFVTFILVMIPFKSKNLQNILLFGCVLLLALVPTMFMIVTRIYMFVHYGL